MAVRDPASYSSLTKTAYYTRSLIKWGIIVFVAFLVLKAGFNFSKSMWQQSHPPAPAPPNIRFGILPRPKFPKKAQPTALTLTIETPTNQVPATAEVGTVYFMPHGLVNLWGAERVTKKANEMGFITALGPEEEKKFIHRFADSSPLSKIMAINEINGEFVITSDFKQNPSLITASGFSIEETIIREARAYLNSFSLLPDDMESGSASVEYYKIGFPELHQAPSLSEADFARVNLQREPVEEAPVLSADPKKTNISLLLSSSSNPLLKVLEVDYHYFSIEKEISGTYPLISSQQAYKNLQNGKCFISSYDKDVKNNSIRRIFLGYYDPASPQSYIQPVVVFEGDYDFQAMCPAIATEWLEKE